MFTLCPKQLFQTRMLARDSQASWCPSTTPGRSTMVIPLGVDKGELPSEDPRKAMTGESYKVSSVAVDVNNYVCKGNVKFKFQRIK